MPCEFLLTAIRDDFLSILGKNLVGMYVHGSIAFGCFSWEKSDVDFIAVAEKPLPHEHQLAIIRALLARTPGAPPKGIEMSVVLKEHCLNFVYPTPFELHFSNAHIDAYTGDIDAHCRALHAQADPDLAAHFAVIREAGHVLCGPAISEVFAPIPRNALLDSVLLDIAEPGEDPLYHTLNLCRALALHEENRLLSKAQGVTWALPRFPEYSSLLQSALNAYTRNIPFDPTGADAFHGEILRRLR